MSRKEKVTRIIDGDTFKTASRKNSVRLARVKAPEIGKPGSVKATQDLKNLIGGKTVDIDTVGRSYNRAVANVKVGKQSVNKTMRDKGHK